LFPLITGALLASVLLKGNGRASSMLRKRELKVVRSKLLLFSFAVMVNVLFIGFSAQSSPGITLAWDASSSANVAGYFVHYGNASGSYPNAIDVGYQTSATVSNLTPGQTFYFVVTAYNVSRTESPPSNEVNYQVPNVLLPTVSLTAPAQNTAYASPANITLSASVVPNGHSIDSVQFYSNSLLLGQVTTPPYSFTWSNVSAGGYSLTARILYDSGSQMASSPVTVSVAALPAPWLTSDVGAPGLVGSAGESNGVFTASGAGNISGTADNFRFLYQTLSGAGEIRAQINGVSQSNSVSRAGVMMRENLSKGARSVFMGISGDGTFRWQRRNSTGANTSSSTSSVGIVPNVWVRLVRTGNTFYGYKSIDGTNWTKVSSRSIAMATNIYFGLAVASGNTNALNTATFTGVLPVP
jgi:hypothetical protein